MAGARDQMRATARKTVGGANCRLEQDGTVRCDFGPRDQAERERSGNPGPGCYVNTGTQRWECPSMPEIHGQPVDQINSVHTDPTTGQTWASVGERKIQVPAFPVSVGQRRRHRSRISRMRPTFTRAVPPGRPRCPDKNGVPQCWVPGPGDEGLVCGTCAGDPLEDTLKIPPKKKKKNPMTNSNQATRRAGRRRRTRGSTRLTRSCADQCVHFKGQPAAYAQCMDQCRGIGAGRGGVRQTKSCEVQCMHFPKGTPAHTQCLQECRGIGYPGPGGPKKPPAPPTDLQKCLAGCLTLGPGGQSTADNKCIRDCQFEALSAQRPSRTRRGRRRRRNQPVPAGQRVATDVIRAAPTGPGNTWTLQDAIEAGCCVFADGQGAYLTCDPLTAGENSPLHGLEVQIQAVHEAEGLATVCHQIFTEGCWRLPLCPDEKAPSTCCVRLGQFPKDGLTFTGMLECTDTSDPLHGTHVMTGQPYQKNGQTYVSFDVGGDVTAELPVCPPIPATRVPPDEPGPDCCVIENADGTFTLQCAPDPHGWTGLNVTGGQCADTQQGRICALEFTDAAGNQVTLEAPACGPPPDIERPPECCVDATTTPPTLQKCSDPSYNGTPVDILDVDEAGGYVVVGVPWSSTPIRLPLCDGPPDERCPTCPPGSYLDTATGKCVTCPPPEECPPSCPPGHWTAPDGSCVQCPPGHLIDPATGQCVRCPPPGDCPTCPPGTYLDTATGQCIRCPECPPGEECPPCEDCPPCPPCRDGRRPPPWECCDEDEDCVPSGSPRLPHFPQPRPVPGCDPDDPCCYECTGTLSNPCDACRAGRRR